MQEFRRTHHNGELRGKDIGAQVRLAGWVHRRRDHGGLIFIDLRDRFGLTQVVFNPETNPEAHQLAETLRAEWVISVQGEVIPRMEGMTNPKLPTGEIEVSTSHIQVLSKAETPPFSICDEMIEVREDLRLKYRYLDIRRGEIADNLIRRHQLMQITRQHLSNQRFIEVTTPVLGKSTPEGARDYLVPSRIQPGGFYALPQSPQLFKQLLMLSGMDRYFQIAPCFRDEDLRADRQPEFMQVDIEMSFSTQEDLMPIIEDLVRKCFKDIISVDIAAPLRRMTYKDCIERYGTDKPDLRFGMELVGLNDIAEQSSFRVFQQQVEAGGVVKGLCVKGGSDISRKGIDEYTAFVGKLGVKGLAWMKMQEGQLASNIVKFFSDEQQKEIISRLGMEDGDLLFMVAAGEDLTNQGLDHLRRKLAQDRNLIPEGQFECLWVTDFPLFEWDEDNQRLASKHHPFTMPHVEDIPLLATDPLKVRSSGYDLVINGYECGGGSQRIHDSELQAKMFELLALSKEEIQEKFGWFVEALSYGTPPHLGIALGVDRLVMILSGTNNIRDVIAFPKTQRASDLMMQAPSPVESGQLDELKLSLMEEDLYQT